MHSDGASNNLSHGMHASLETNADKPMRSEQGVIPLGEAAYITLPAL